MRTAAIYASDTDAGPLDKRKDLQRLLLAASNKEFETVLVTRLDRFGTTKDAAAVCRRLQASGVKVFDEIGEITEDIISGLENIEDENPA